MHMHSFSSNHTMIKHQDYTWMGSCVSRIGPRRSSAADTWERLRKTGKFCWNEVTKGKKIEECIRFYHLRALKQHSDMPSLFLITHCLHMCLNVHQFNHLRKLDETMSVHRRNNVSQVELMLMWSQDLAVLISMNSNPTVLSSWFEHGYPYSYCQTALSTVLKPLTGVFRYDVHCKKSNRLFFIVLSKWCSSIVAMTESRWLKAFCVIHFNTTHKPLSRNHTLTHKTHMYKKPSQAKYGSKSQ